LGLTPRKKRYLAMYCAGRRQKLRVSGYRRLNGGPEEMHLQHLIAGGALHAYPVAADIHYMLRLPHPRLSGRCGAIPGELGHAALAQAEPDNRHQGQCSGAAPHTGWRGWRRCVFPLAARAFRRAA
jgi:hypothetical protein